MGIKISNLPAATSVSTGDILPVVQGGVTKKVSVQKFIDTAALVGPPGEDGEDGTGGGSNLDWVNPKDYGAVGDGSSHPLSEFYDTLAEAQVDFPFATSLTQEIDYCAIKKASNIAFGGDLEYDEAEFLAPGHIIGTSSGTVVELPGQNFEVDELVGQTFFGQFVSNDFIVSSPIVSNTADTVTTATALGLTSDSSRWLIGQGEHGNLSELNRPLYIPGGKYMFGADTWTIRNLRSGVIRGAGRLATQLFADDIVLQFDGVWYTHISDIFFGLNSDAGTTAVDMDGNVPGHDYATRGVQGVTWDNCFFYGAMSTAAFSCTRQGSSGGQGSECLFLNCHFQAASFACYQQHGFNALANTIMGGNFQAYPKHGIYVVSGTVSVYNTGFQSTMSDDMVVNDGWDIRIGESGAFEGCCIDGCRTESLNFLNNDGAVRCAIRGVVQRPAVLGWFAEYGGYEVGTGILASEDPFSYLWVAQNEGTTGASQPTWSDDGSTPVMDGDVEWQPYPITFIRNILGSVDWNSCAGVGLFIGDSTLGREDEVDSGPWYVSSNAAVTTIDASGGGFDVYMPDWLGLNAKFGRIVVLRRVDKTANVVNLISSVIMQESVLPANTTLVMYLGRLQAGSNAWLTLVRDFGRKGAEQINIVSGAIAASADLMTVETEGAASTDDLDTINGGRHGMRIVLSPYDEDHTVVVKNGTGNIRLAGSDCTLDGRYDTVELIYSENYPGWLETSRSDNST